MGISRLSTLKSRQQQVLASHGEHHDMSFFLPGCLYIVPYPCDYQRHSPVIILRALKENRGIETQHRNRPLNHNSSNGVSGSQTKPSRPTRHTVFSFAMSPPPRTREQACLRRISPHALPAACKDFALVPCTSPCPSNGLATPAHFCARHRQGSESTTIVFQQWWQTWVTCRSVSAHLSSWFSEPLELVDWARIKLEKGEGSFDEAAIGRRPPRVV